MSIKETKVATTVYLPKDLRKKAKIEASTNDESLSALIEMALEKELRRRGIIE